MMLTLKRTYYIFGRVMSMFLSIVSRLYNALILGGSTHQTTSARMYIENWPKGRAFINLFFCNRFYCFQEDHCKWAWEQEVIEATRTLMKNEAL